MVDLTNIVLAGITLIIAIVAVFVIPYFRSKTTAEQFSTIKLWVTVAVNAAEQLFIGSGRGEEKKNYVLNFLESKGFTIDLESIDALIESAVLDLNKSTTNE